VRRKLEAGMFAGSGCVVVVGAVTGGIR